VEALEQLTALSPDYPRYFVELAYAYRAQGDKAKALATYSHAADLAARPKRARRTGAIMARRCAASVICWWTRAIWRGPKRSIAPA
jgi:predicted Zn-dependent protease